MSKRGKYKSYLGVARRERKPKTDRLMALNTETYQQRITDGINMYSKVHVIRWAGYPVGSYLNFHRSKSHENERDGVVSGSVVAKYDHFILVDNGRYKTTVMYEDLVMGGYYEED